jgi:hypothetical protein
VEVGALVANANAKYLTAAVQYYRLKSLILIQKKKKMDGDYLVR